MSVLKTKSSNVDANVALYHRIRGGDKAAISEMIERNMPLVVSRVGNFLNSYRKYRHLNDDLIGEGYMALTTAVNSFVTDAAAKPTGKIVFRIDKALGDYIDSEVGAGQMSVRTVQRRRSQSKSLPNQLPFDIDNPPANLWPQADGRVIRKQIVDEGEGWDKLGSHDHADHTTDQLAGATRMRNVSQADAKELIRSQVHPDTTPETDLLDTILACCECEEDEMIVSLRLKGYVDAEIGEQMGISQQTVNIRRKAIEQRYEERQSE